MKRLPTIVPYLAPENLKGQNAGGQRNGLIPQQTTLSVQDVVDYSTPEGSSMANEEMRRLRLGIESLANQIQPNGGSGAGGNGNQPVGVGNNTNTSTGGGTGGGTNNNENIWAETTELDKQIIVKRVNQDLRFTKAKKIPDERPYPFPVDFALTKEQLEKELRTIDEAQRTIIQAFAMIDPGLWMNYYMGMQSVERVQDPFRDPRFNMPIKAYFHLVNDEQNPQPNQYYGTDGDRYKGFHSIPIGQNGCYEILFDYTDTPNPVSLFTSANNMVIQEIQLELSTRFDNSQVFTIGNDSTPGFLMGMANSDNIPKKFSIRPDYKFTDVQNIKLYFTTTSTVGSGRVLVYYAIKY